MKRFKMKLWAAVCAAAMVMSCVPVMAAPAPEETLPVVVEENTAATEFEAAVLAAESTEESQLAEPESLSVEETEASAEDTAAVPETETTETEAAVPETETIAPEAETVVPETEAAVPETVETVPEAEESASALSVETASSRRTYLEGFVTRLYELCLGRTARQDEVDFWADRLENGQDNGAGVASGFIFSEEYMQKNTSDTSYVEMLYRTILGREADNSGVQTWMSYLNRGASRQWVFAGFVNSVEFSNICANYQVTRGDYQSNEVRDQNLDVTSFVIRLYEYCLGRRPSPYEDGVNDWVRCILDGSMTGADAAWGFLSSQEMENRNLSDSDYVDVLYRALMGREPDGGKSTWMGELDKGVSRRYVARGFLTSQEFTNICNRYGIVRGDFTVTEVRDQYPDLSGFVKGFYEVCLGRTPKGNELNDWVGRLARKETSGSDLASGFFFSTEYTRKNRSNYDFVADCYKALLGRTGTESERNDWVQRLNSGWSRETVMSYMVDSQEYRKKCSALGVALMRNGWMTVGGKTYYVQNDGKLSGWQTIDGTRYYFDPSDGNARAQGWVYADGYKYYFNSDGTLRTDLDSLIGKQSSYQIKVNRQCNTVTVYAKDGNNGYIIPVKSFICSTGAAGATPLGTYQTPNKYRWHELMGPVYGQWCTRIVNGVLFHSVYYSTYNNTTLSVSAYNQLGSSVSHGCVRLTAGDAKWIYDNCALGTTVIVYDSSTPGPYGKPSSYTLPSWHTWDPTDPTAYSRCQQRGCH